MEKSRFDSGFWNNILSGKFQSLAFIQGFDRSIERLDQLEKDNKKQRTKKRK
jgi:hypothetical protein